MPQNTPNLKDTQKLLWELITWPEGVHDALKHRPDVVLPVTGSAALSAADRLNIYADMYFFRIEDALKEDFPRLLKELGEEGFHNLMVDYLHAHPPRHFSLRNAGENLAEFVIARARSARGNLGCANEIATPAARDDTLATIARFEWALVEAFDAADAALLSEDDLKKIPAADWPDLILKLHPSVRLLARDHTVVWRKGLDVVYLQAPADEWNMLSQIHAGCDFATLCEGAAPEKILGHLRHWITQELLAAFAQ